jgi:dephospho-CoA kinase
VVVVGASGAGKSTLVAAVRGAGLPSVDVPRRIVTRAPRGDGPLESLENEHVSHEEFARRVHAGLIALHWERHMDAGRVERYGFPPPRPGVLPVYSANNSIPPVSGAFVVGVVAPDAVREARIRKRSPGLAPAEVAHRLADSALPACHALLENHGALEELAQREIVRLIEEVLA